MVVLAATASYASTITFDFNTRSSGVSLAQNANNAGIQTYMNLVLGAAGSVTVSGARADNGYTGDNHVVGPCSGSSCTSKTLAKDQTVSAPITRDTFIINNSPTYDAFTMTFTGLSIYWVSFDYEIFPDGTCPKLSQCGTNQSNLPDFKFLANDGTNKQFFGALPTSPGYTHSPNSGSSSNELAPQALGHYEGYLNGASTLTFQDWPATIGIDNLVIQTNVPEPATFFLLGAGVIPALRRRRAKKN